MTLTRRAITGAVVLPTGVAVDSGEVIFQLTGAPPAGSLSMATCGVVNMAIDEYGEISGYIVTPGTYSITVNTGDGFSFSFSASVTETSPADPLTLQAILAAT